MPAFGFHSGRFRWSASFGKIGPIPALVPGIAACVCDLQAPRHAMENCKREDLYQDVELPPHYAVKVSYWVRVTVSPPSTPEKCGDKRC